MYGPEGAHVWEDDGWMGGWVDSQWEDGEMGAWVEG